jgi:hypothetical protein
LSSRRTDSTRTLDEPVDGVENGEGRTCTEDGPGPLADDGSELHTGAFLLRKQKARRDDQTT